MKKLLKSKTFLGAVMSIALCVSLIAGATFAIFTSDANVNIAIGTATVKVTAKIGELKTYSGVEITGSENDRIKETATNGTFTNGGTASVDGNTVKIDKMTPGDKVEFPVKVTNHSNVTVKYRMKISYANDNGLFNQLDMKIENYSGLWKELQPKSSIATLNCSIMLPTSSTLQEGNCDITLLVEAVQGNAAVVDDEQQLVFDAGSLKETLAKGGTVEVNKNIKTENIEDSFGARFIISAPTTLNLNAKIISPDNMGNNNTNFCALFVDADTIINATEEGGIDTGVNGGYGINVRNGATLIVNGGNYYGGGTAIQVQKGTLIINGGFFACEPYSNPVYGYKYLINCIDSAWQDGSAKISITGGTFVNFDPSNSASENPNGNFVAEGYSVIKETKENGDVWYTVVKGTGAVVGSQDDLNSAISANATATVKLTEEGTYTLPSLDTKDVTIIGTKDTVINMKGELNKASSVAFEGVTVEFANDNYKGFQHTGKLVYKDCTIKNLQFLYADEVEFINCKFEQENDDAYHIWTYGAKNVTFTGCKFFSKNNSKSILCYIEGTGNEFTRTFNNCEFVCEGTAEKSAIMINPTANACANTYTININNCTATGYAENGITGQTIVGVKETVKDNITVNIDGKTVYSH